MRGLLRFRSTRWWEESGGIALLTVSGSVLIVHGAWFAHVNAGLRRSLVGAGLQAYDALATGSQLFFAKLALVLLRHLRSKRRPVETFVETLYIFTQESMNVCLRQRLRE